MHVQRDYIVICGGVNGSMVFTYRGSLVLKRLFKLVNVLLVNA